MSQTDIAKKQIVDLTNPQTYQFLSFIHQPAILLDLNQTIIDFNHHAHHEFDWIHKKMIGKNWCSVLEFTELKQNTRQHPFKHNSTLNADLTSENVTKKLSITIFHTTTVKNSLNGYLAIVDVHKYSNPLLSSRIIDSIPVAIYIKDTKDVVIDCNKYMAKILGSDHYQDFIGLDSYSLATEGSEQVKQNDIKVIKANKTQSFEETITLEGKKRTFLTTKSPYKDSHGNILGIIGISIDITKKKLLENSLIKKMKMSEKNSIDAKNDLERIIANIPYNVWWTDKQGVFLGCSDKVIKLLGQKTRSDIIGRHYLEIAKGHGWESQAKKFLSDDFDVISTGIAKENVLEPPLISNEGKPIYYMSTRTPLYDENDVIKGVIGISADITERVQMEKELKDAKEKVEIANQTKTDFLATLSHELRTPLNGILGVADILSRQGLGKNNLSLIKDISKSGQSLLALINDLLDISKIEANELDIDKIPFDLKEIVFDVASHLNSQFKKKKLNLKINYDMKSDTHFMGDPQRIKQVLFNLLGNALKFTEKGTIDIDVQCTQEKGDYKTMQISVTDTGIGIPKNKLKSIFDRFTQVNSSYTRNVSGTGLGLNIVKNLLTLMGGDIKVTSRLHVGSTFTVTLPLVVQDSHVVTNYKELSSDAILIVDDDISAGSELIKSIGMHNIQLVSELRTISTLEKAANQKNYFQIVIINISNPHSKWQTILQEINDNTLLKSPSIIAYGNKLTQLQKTQLKKWNVASYLNTPIQHEALIKLIKLERKHYAKSLRKSSKQLRELETKVLLAEDNPINRKVASIILKELNCHVDICNNGLSAVDQYKSSTYDIVFMDIGLPDIDGHKVTKKIRSYEKSQKMRTPIIAMTAYASENDKQNCLNAGMDDIVIKPIDRQGIEAILTKWLISEKLA